MGRARDDAWFVGGGLGNPGYGALVLTRDGRALRERAVGHAETLWWVWGDDGGAAVWSVGERGLALPLPATRGQPSPPRFAS